MILVVFLLVIVALLRFVPISPPPPTEEMQNYRPTGNQRHLVLLLGQHYKKWGGQVVGPS